MLRKLLPWLAAAVVLSAAPARAQGVAECDFGFEIDTQSSAFQSMVVDGEAKRGFWLSVNRAPQEVRDLGRFVGRLQSCLVTPDGQSRTLNRGGTTITLKSPFIANCTATLLPGNRLLTNRHCFYDPALEEAGFTIVLESRVNFGYTSKDDTGSVKTFRVLPREIAVTDINLDAMVLQVIGDANGSVGGHVPMRMKTDIEPFQQLLVIHHPGADPQQFSTGTCQVHRRQSEIAPDRAPFRHTCETMGGSSGSLIFDARTLAIVALHNQGGLQPTGDSYNAGNKIAMVNTALNLGLEEDAPTPSAAPTVDVETAARAALFEAMLEPDRARRIGLLRDLIPQFDGTQASTRAAEALARLVAAEAGAAEADRKRAEEEARRAAEAEKLRLAAAEEAKRLAEAEIARRLAEIEAERAAEEAEQNAAPSKPKPVEPDRTADAGNGAPGWLGVKVQDVSEELAEALALDTVHGVIVEEVSGGPARAAGIAKTDVILTLDGVKLAGTQDLVNRISALPAGRTVRLGLYPAGRVVSATLIARPAAVKPAANPCDALQSAAVPGTCEDMQLYLSQCPDHGAVASMRSIAEARSCISPDGFAGAGPGPVPPAAPTPGTVTGNSCAALQQRAVTPGTCPDLTAFLSQCSDHPAVSTMTRIAQAKNCSVTATVSAPVRPAPTPPVNDVSLADRMANNSDVQSCDRSAGDPYHPDRESGLMRPAGIVEWEIEFASAIHNCVRALVAFPDHPRLSANLGRAYLMSGDDNGALDAFDVAMNGGDPMAIYWLAIFGNEGWGPAAGQDFIGWLEESASAGYAPAAYELGVYYEDGQVVPVDGVEAAFWFRRAAEAGHADAMNAIANYYANGSGGLTQSDAEALDWYWLAVEAGSAYAMVNLGRSYENGWSVPVDPELAAELFILSLQAGDTYVVDRDADLWAPETARAVQHMLRDWGYYDGPIDGQIGAGSRAAMEALLP